MTKLPAVTIEALHLSDLFFNYRTETEEMGTLDAAKEFVQLAGLEEQVTAEQLVKDFKDRE